ncbi:MAG: glycerophosphodiester phosphodiesterase [Clostridia bacterium]|nr:glycerophosphodiester phosphodiesterase [Clostridia bacterium]
MTLIYGHRGASGDYPENTMLAFQKAYEQGAEGIEYDVHLTKDGVPVVMHDENTVRTTGVDALIKDLTAEEFLALDAGKVKNGACGVCNPPTLDELLAWCAETGMRSNIELKTGVYEYPGIEEKVIALLDKYGLRETTLISSFNHFTIGRVRALAPDIRVGLLEESWLIGAGAYVKACGADDFNPYVKFLNDETVRELREHGVGINTWTVNEEEDMLRTLGYGVEIGISNWPARYIALRAEFEKEQK